MTIRLDNGDHADQSAYQEGMVACRMKEKNDMPLENPYEAGSVYSRSWERGYNEEALKHFEIAMN